MTETLTPLEKAEAERIRHMLLATCDRVRAREAERERDEARAECTRLREAITRAIAHGTDVLEAHFDYGHRKRVRVIIDAIVTEFERRTTDK